jgi:hypothetical protein
MGLAGVLAVIAVPALGGFCNADRVDLSREAPDEPGAAVAVEIREWPDSLEWKEMCGGEADSGRRLPLGLDRLLDVLDVFRSLDLPDGFYIRLELGRAGIGLEF